MVILDQPDRLLSQLILLRVDAVGHRLVFTLGHALLNRSLLLVVHFLCEGEDHFLQLRDFVSVGVRLVQLFFLRLLVNQLLLQLGNDRVGLGQLRSQLLPLLTLHLLKVRQGHLLLSANPLQVAVLLRNRVEVLAHVLQLPLAAGELLKEAAVL